MFSKNFQKKYLIFFITVLFLISSTSCLAAERLNTIHSIELTFESYGGAVDWLSCMRDSLKMSFGALLDGEYLVALLLLIELIIVEFYGGLFVLIINLISFGYVNLWWLFVSIDNACIIKIIEKVVTS